MISPKKESVVISNGSSTVHTLPVISPNQTLTKFDNSPEKTKFLQKHYDAIPEDIQSIKDNQSVKKGAKFENSFGKQSAMGDADELINWAKDLPDDIEVSGGTSFYNKMKSPVKHTLKWHL